MGRFDHILSKGGGFWLKEKEMLLLITPDRFNECADLIHQMHRLRYRVFKQRLGWEVDGRDDSEVDEFDSFRPVYLVHTNARSEVDGCVRLLPTTGPTMLSHVFSELLGGKPVPNSVQIWESSRFCLDSNNDSSISRGSVSHRFCTLCRGIIEFGLSRNLSQIVTVTDLRIERLTRNAGWPLTRISLPQEVGDTRAVVGYLEISRLALSKIRETGTIQGPTLWEPVSASASFPNEMGASARNKAA